MMSLRRCFDRIQNALAVGMVIIAFALGIVLIQREAKPVMSINDISTLVIDPGHGGIDGGAISGTGVKESDINLSIALKLRALADLYGQNCVMTRDRDVSFTVYPDYSEHEELVRRVEIANKAQDAVLMSIHQNCFPDWRAEGSQILYAKTPGSKEFGERMRENFLFFLDPDNRRLAQPAPEKLYVTANVSCPALLIECGFMSNAEDCALLTDDNYQTKLASVMLATYFQYKDNTI